MQALMVLSACSIIPHRILLTQNLAIGLQYKFKSLQWLATVPPLVIVIFFKIFVNIKFDKDFKYHVPNEQDLKEAKIHSERADHKGHRLANRFGHPALHSKLFTPMLHAKMMPLLAEVYKGKVEHEKIRESLNERGGKKLDVQVVEGIKIAAIEQV